ncbi:MAG: mechanosensitive ion channel [Candidatus Omnitrophica bacterium]|nr:mechanosensitive ion channel [Candidatus Omnitrophota bacterium]
MNIEQITAKLYEYAITYGLNVLAAFLIFVIGKWLARIGSEFLAGAMERAKVDVTLANFIKNIAYVGMLAFVIVSALNKLGVETTSFIALIGAAGLAVGLALQGSLSNFAAGVMLVIFKPFKIGDFIQAGGEMGTVKEIQIFNTIIHAPDNRLVIVPNSKVTSDNITNFSNIENRRVDLTFGISYQDDIKKAKDVLARVVAAEERVLAEPKPVIAVFELGESSVNLVCRPWVKPQDYWDVYFSITEKAKIELEKNGITIPFPQRDLHVYNESVKAETSKEDTKQRL